MEKPIINAYCPCGFLWVAVATDDFACPKCEVKKIKKQLELVEDAMFVYGSRQSYEDKKNEYLIAQKMASNSQ